MQKNTSAFVDDDDDDDDDTTLLKRGERKTVRVRAVVFPLFFVVVVAGERRESRSFRGFSRSPSKTVLKEGEKKPSRKEGI